MDPSNLHVANYAGFLLGQGREKEGREFLERVLQRSDLRDWPGLAAESWFYAFVHWPIEKRQEALRNLKKMLMEGDHSQGSDLTLHIARARATKHDALLWIEKLAAVIAESADLNTLDEWEAWRHT